MQSRGRCPKRHTLLRLSPRVSISNPPAERWYKHGMEIGDEPRSRMVEREGKIFLAPGSGEYERANDLSNPLCYATSRCMTPCPSAPQQIWWVCAQKGTGTPVGNFLQRAISIKRQSYGDVDRIPARGRERASHLAKSKEPTFHSLLSVFIPPQQYVYYINVRSRYGCQA